MAPETYYFFFSIIVALTSVLFMLIMSYYRLKGKTILGDLYKKGSVEDNYMRKYSSNRSLTIGGVITLLGIANLVYDIYRILHLGNQEYAVFIFVFAPVFLAIIAIPVGYSIYRQYGKQR